MNYHCHGETRSVVAIQLDHHARRGRALVMTTSVFISRGAKRAVAIQLDCFGALRLGMTVSG